MIDLFTAKPSPGCPLASHHLGLVIAEIAIALPSTTSFFLFVVVVKIICAAPPTRSEVRKQRETRRPSRKKKKHQPQPQKFYLILRPSLALSPSGEGI